MEAKSGTGQSVVPPAAPTVPEVPDLPDPGEMAEIKAEQITNKEGKYGSEETTPHKPKESSESSSGSDESGSEETTEETELSWIEIQMIGEDDKPLPGIKYKVTLPDDTVDEGTTDQDGKARVEGFEKGDCKVTFPELDSEAWEKA
jgi:hypothetical protein